jgi:hypothetical protein
VRPPFLTREEVEPQSLDPKNRRTHHSSIAQGGSSTIIRSLAPMTSVYEGG